VENGACSTWNKKALNVIVEGPYHKESCSNSEKIKL
jgi:hypothetical protein